MLKKGRFSNEEMQFIEQSEKRSGCRKRIKNKALLSRIVKSVLVRRA